jgi:aspartate/methionine/tyrosine aminotransferase
MRQAYHRRRDVAVDALAAAGMLIAEPCGAFYVLADVSRATDSTAAFARSLVADHGVAVAPGSTFGPGGERSVRLSLASSEAMIGAGIARLARAVAGRASETIRGA